MSLINQEVQTILFSATMGPSVNRLTSATTSKPIRISADPDNVLAFVNIENCRETTPANDKIKRVK